MVWAKATPFPPPAASITHMIFGYSGGLKRRILRYLLAAFVVGFIIFCEVRRQSSPLDLPPPGPRENQIRGPSARESTRGRLDDQLLRENDEATQTIVGATTRPVVGKITISFGEPDAVYERAIRSHEYHNKRMGYPQFVLRERVLSGLWSKHAYIISVLVQELAKPVDQRLQWLMFVSSEEYCPLADRIGRWLDRDTVLMNPNLQLEMFIPPAGFENIHLLMTNDRHGLNNGVFFFRVNEWSLKFFSLSLAFGHYNPEVKLKYTEQSAMEEVMKRYVSRLSTFKTCSDSTGLVQKVNNESTSEMVQCFSSTARGRKGPQVPRPTWSTTSSLRIQQRRPPPRADDSVDGCC